MGLGTELLLLFLLGFLILGPKQMHAPLGHVGRTKVLFDQLTRSLKSQFTLDFEAPADGSKPEPPPA